MKNNLRLIVIVLKTAVAAYLIGCVGLSGLKQMQRLLGDRMEIGTAPLVIERKSSIAIELGASV